MLCVRIGFHLKTMRMEKGKWSILNFRVDRLCYCRKRTYTLLGPCILGNRGGITRIFSCFCPLRIQKQGKYQ